MQKHRKNHQTTRSQIEAIFPMLTNAHVPVALSAPSGGRVSLWRGGSRSIWVADDPASLDAFHDGSFTLARTTSALLDMRTESLLLIVADKVEPTAVANEFELSYTTLGLAGQLESCTDRSIATPAHWRDFEIWLARMLEDAMAHEMVMWIALCDDDGATQLVTQGFIGVTDDTVGVELAWNTASSDEQLGHRSAHPLEEVDTVIARAGRLLTETFQEFAPSPLRLRFGFTLPEPVHGERSPHGVDPVETSDS